MKPFTQLTVRMPTCSRRARRFLLLGLAAGLLTLSVIVAHSVNIPQNNSRPLGGTTEAQQPKLAGLVLQDPLRPFTITNKRGVIVASGKLQDRVVRENQTGTLDFYCDVRLDSTSKLPVRVVSRTIYPVAGPLDTDWRIDGTGVDAPDLARRNGNRVTYEFNTQPIRPGQQSRAVFISTQAKNYERNGTTVLETSDGASTILTTWAPRESGEHAKIRH